MISQDEIKALQCKICQHDDELAFRELYFACMPYLLKFANTILKNKTLAEEAVSDIFLNIWQNRVRLNKVGNFKLYLYISTKNRSLNYLSRHFSNDVISLEEMSINTSLSPYNPEQLLITSEAVKRINQEIEKLPPRCKLIFKLVKEDRLKYNDIANLLNISVKTIDSQMAIAIKKISSAINFQMSKHSLK